MNAETKDVLRQLQEVEYNENAMVGYSAKLRRELSFVDIGTHRDTVLNMLEGGVEHAQEMLAGLRKLKNYVEGKEAESRG